MNLALFFHLLVHTVTGVIAGFIVYRYWKSKWAFVIAIVSATLIDMDHWIDYIFVFGTNFNLQYFFSGYHFLLSDKIYVFFHAWEYVVILLVLFLIIKKAPARYTCLAVALGILLHLGFDVYINRIPPITYSIIFRAHNNFNIEKLVYPEHYQKHILLKKEFDIKSTLP